MSTNELNKHLEKCRRLTAEASFPDCENDKAIKKLTKALYEADCIEELICEKIRKKEEKLEKNELTEMLNTSASGSIDLIGDNWLYMRLETLLPSDKKLAEVKRVSNTVTNLLDYYSDYAGGLPRFDRAFVAIIEHKSSEDVDKVTFDNDNKGYRAIPNALKGRVFDDDNQFIMSLGLFTVENRNDPHCDIYVIPYEDIAEFATFHLNF